MAKLEKLGAILLPLHLTEHSSIVQAAERIRAEQGHIDVLVNNVGYGSHGAVEDVPLDEARRPFEVNVFGLARLVHRPQTRHVVGAYAKSAVFMAVLFPGRLNDWLMDTITKTLLKQQLRESATQAA
jgi:NAD(P)-dependent dehydrogenase (short-subunit alcohol dehydrogenase family)